MKNTKGFTLLISIVTTALLLLVSFVVANVALKQILLSSANQESQYAFYNADSGTDCATYWDLKDPDLSAFATSTAGSITCNGQTITTGSQVLPTVPSTNSIIGGGGVSNPTSIFVVNYTKGCAIVRVTKTADGGTSIDSRGYNNCTLGALRRFERGIILSFDTAGSIINPLTPPGTWNLTGILAGTGSGTITGNGLNCAPTCTTTVADGTLVTLIATPTGGSTFTGWSGACSGSGACNITMNDNKTVTATFASGGFTIDNAGTLKNSLISYWKLDEASGARTDSIGSNSLSDSGTTGSVVGKINSAPNFTGVTYLQHADNASLSTGNTSFTISAWVKLTNKTTYDSIVGKDEYSSGSREYMLARNSDTDKWTFWINAADPSYTVVDSPSAISTGTWYFLVAWFDASAHTLNLQVNNGAVNSVSSGAAIPIDGIGAFEIGARNLLSYPINGVIDEVGFWKKTLSVQERTDLYNSGIGNTYNP